MDLAAICAAVLHRMGLGGPREVRKRQQDPADMGTAYGLEASLAPPLTEPPTDGADFRLDTGNAWLHPR